jgi:hypothetical protein
MKRSGLQGLKHLLLKTRLQNIPQELDMQMAHNSHVNYKHRAVNEFQLAKS